MEQPVTPFWFKQRQAKLEPAGDQLFRVSGPNLAEAFIGIRPGPDGKWAAMLKQTADGPDLAATEPEFDAPGDAWGAAFEMFRTRFVV